jgi:multimeric flavodoxin WrbA
MENGNTAKILTHFLKGMENAGAVVELFYARRLNVKPCDGTFYCWMKKPGECYIKDDMQSLYTKLREADIFVLATPVFVPLPGEMQNLLNRLIPFINPVLRRQKGRTRGKLRDDVKLKKLVLVSSSGWWETGNFGAVLKIAKELAKNLNLKFAAAVLRPHATCLTMSKEKAEEVFEAARQAGYQIVKEGKVSEALLKVISQPLIPEEMWYHQ